MLWLDDPHMRFTPGMRSPLHAFDTGTKCPIRPTGKRSLKPAFFSDLYRFMLDIAIM
jgi:hypothetical protein